MNVNEKRIEDLQDLIDVQTADGHWNHDPYMHGMANGMILAMATIKCEQCTFLEAPDVFMEDLPGYGKHKPVVATDTESENGND